MKNKATVIVKLVGYNLKNIKSFVSRLPIQGKTDESMLDYFTPSRGKGIEASEGDIISAHSAKIVNLGDVGKKPSDIQYNLTFTMELANSFIEVFKIHQEQNLGLFLERFKLDFLMKTVTAECSDILLTLQFDYKSLDFTEGMSHNGMGINGNMLWAEMAQQATVAYDARGTTVADNRTEAVFDVTTNGVTYTTDARF